MVKCGFYFGSLQKGMEWEIKMCNQSPYREAGKFEKAEKNESKELMKQLNRAMSKLDDAKFIIERVYAEMSKKETKHEKI